MKNLTVLVYFKQIKEFKDILKIKKLLVTIRAFKSILCSYAWVTNLIILGKLTQKSRHTQNK